MGVKSTVSLTREEAERRYVNLLLDDSRSRLELAVQALSNTVLENALEGLNDEIHDGEGYENYLISEP